MQPAPAPGGCGDCAAAEQNAAAELRPQSRTARLLAGAEDFLATASFVALAAVVFLQFFTRYFLNAPLGWTEEVARYLLIVAAYFGCVVATRRDAHIKLELLGALVSPRVAAMVSRGLGAAVFALLCAWLVWLMLDLILRSRRAMTSMPWVSLKVIYWPVLLCFVAMAARSAASFFIWIKSKSKSR